MTHFSLQELSEIWLKTYIGVHVKYPFFSSDINELEFYLDKFSKNTPIPNFIKIHPVGAEFFLADGQTDMTKLIVAFRNFPNAAKTNMSKSQVTDRYISNCEILVQEGGGWRPRWNSELHSLYNGPNIVEDIKIRILGWAGHIIRMEEERIPKKVLNGNFYVTKPVGRPRI